MPTTRYYDEKIKSFETASLSVYDSKAKAVQPVLFEV
jgi:hypothetical protein